VPDISVAAIPVNLGDCAMVGGAAQLHVRQAQGKAMNQETYVTIPPAYEQVEHVLDPKHEEDALCWLWAFSSMLPWDYPIEWLYTPVVGKKHWPGDLLGVDSHGNLLIIEAKRCKRNDDAFVDFRDFHQDGRIELSATHWMRKWEVHYRAEVSFHDGFSERCKGKTDGILPRSNRRQHIRRWIELARNIDDHIRSCSYFLAVNGYLNTRRRQNDPLPYYIALMIMSERQRRVLSDATVESSRRLRQKVGHDHVLAVSIKCERTVEGKAKIATSLIGLQ
jgi:hypothetical protein